MEQTLKFVKYSINKNFFHQSKKPININNVDIAIAVLDHYA